MSAAKISFAPMLGTMGIWYWAMIHSQAVWTISWTMYSPKETCPP